MAVYKWVASAALTCLLANVASAQYVISARSGLIHYTEGEVLLADKPIAPKLGEYPEVKEGQHLQSKEGRAEVLLTPGVFLRLTENSEIAMVSNRLADTRVEVVQGSIILEAGEVAKEHAISILVNGSAIEIRKSGMFRVDAGTLPRVRVYDGEVAVLTGGAPMTVKEGKQILLSSVPVIEKFSKEDSDSFLRWAGRRSNYLATANLVAANQIREQGGQWSTGGWYFNPMIGMFTYIPMNGRYHNYWNNSYYSPSAVAPPQTIISNPRVADGFSAMNSSVRGMQDTSGRSYSGGNQAAPIYQAPATASPAPAPVASGEGRGADSGGSRGGSSGRR